MEVFRHLLFLPSITFGLLNAEIFPWGVIYFALQFNWKLPIRPGLFLTLALTSAILSFVGGAAASEVLRSSAAYANALLAFSAIQMASRREVELLLTVARRTFYLLLIVGAIQVTGFISQFDWVFEALIPRGSADVFGGERGVLLLSSEPSRAGVELVFIYALLRGTIWANDSRSFLFDVAVGIFLILIVRSAVAVAFYSVFLALIYRHDFRKVFGVAIVALLAPVLGFWEIEARAISVALELTRQQSLSDAADFLMRSSGFRYISVYSAYSLIFEYPLGFGVGNWAAGSIVSLRESGFDPREFGFFVYHHNSDFVALRPTAFAAGAALEMGILGLLGAILIVLQILRRCRNLYNSDYLPIFVIFLVSIFLIGSIGSPIYWVCIAIYIRICAMDGLIVERIAQKQSIKRKYF